MSAVPRAPRVWEGCDRAASVLYLGLAGRVEMGWMSTAGARVGASAGAFAILVGCLALVGWAADIATLKSVASGLVALKANAAVAFVLAGVALLLAQHAASDRRRRTAARACAGAVVLIAGLTLGQSLTGWDLGIDQLLFRDLGATAAEAPGRMGGLLAASLVLVGLALLGLHGERREARWGSQVLALAVALLAWQTLLGYVCGAVLYTLPSYRDAAVPVHAALALTALCAGLLASDPDRGLMALVTRESAGGYVARRLLPAALTVPSVLGLLVLAGQRVGLYDNAAGVSLMAAASVALFAALIAWNAGALEKMEEKRDQLIREQAARAQAEAAERRSSFLAEASAALGASLDYKSTLATVAQLAVPVVADWCAIHLADEQGVARQLVVAHADPSKVELAWALARRYSAPGTTHGPARVMETGQAELVADGVDRMLEASTRDQDLLAVLRGLGIGSYMIVPLVARQQRLGTITLASAASSRRFAPGDLAFAEELARRVALAVDNARLYEAEATARSAAEAASRAKDTFLATVSHELRTPLSPILAWSRMLRRGGLSQEKERRALEAIERCAKSQARLVEDLLDVSRIITGKLGLEVRPLDLAPVIRSAVEVVRPAAEAKDIRLVTVLDEDIGPVMGDPDRLKQVVWNLVSNAVKFTPRGGRVQLVLRRSEAHVEIAVRDTGQGIPAEFLAHVFQRFEQADGTPTRAHGGLGLGLAIVRHIVELHGGSVHVESRGEGHGALFTVQLPLMATEAAGETERVGSGGGAREVASVQALEGLRVLVVDDEPDSNDVVGTLLSAWGAEVRMAASAWQALETLAEWRPDVLVTDIGMPDVDGYELLGKIRSQQGAAADILAVALTAYAGREDRLRLLSAGFQAHVPKPVDPEELATVVASLTRTVRRA